jgi:hypothetical protein
MTTVRVLVFRKVKKKKEKISKLPRGYVGKKLVARARTIRDRTTEEDHQQRSHSKSSNSFVRREKKEEKKFSFTTHFTRKAPPEKIFFLYLQEGFFAFAIQISQRRRDGSVRVRYDIDREILDRC